LAGPGLAVLAGLRIGGVPEPAERDRKRRAYEAVRRREAVTMLRVAEAMCGYAASQLADGLSPEEARAAAIEAAGELAALAAGLRRLTRLRPADRRVLAAQLAALGLSRREVAGHLGVSDRAVRGYLARSNGHTSPKPRPPPGVTGASG
jgi:hypothetical protein